MGQLLIMSIAVDRFLSKIRQGDGGCWLWTGGHTHNGYGRFQFNGTEERAHRFSYRHFIGVLPAYTYSDGELDHLCRNRNCVNPTHLELVPHRINIRRGRSGYSLKSAETCAKLKAARARNPQSPMTGLKHSSETKKKMAAARRAYWQRKKESAA